jgi:hypothetical protein
LAEALPADWGVSRAQLMCPGCSSDRWRPESRRRKGGAVVGTRYRPKEDIEFPRKGRCCNGRWQKGQRLGRDINEMRLRSDRLYSTRLDRVPLVSCCTRYNARFAAVAGGGSQARAACGGALGGACFGIGMDSGGRAIGPPGEGVERVQLALSRRWY